MELKMHAMYICERDIRTFRKCVYIINCSCMIVSIFIIIFFQHVKKKSYHQKKNKLK